MDDTPLLLPDKEEEDDGGYECDDEAPLPQGCWLRLARYVHPPTHPWYDEGGAGRLVAAC